MANRLLNKKIKIPANAIDEMNREMKSLIERLEK